MARLHEEAFETRSRNGKGRRKTPPLPAATSFPAHARWEVIDGRKTLVTTPPPKPEEEDVAQVTDLELQPATA